MIYIAPAGLLEIDCILGILYILLHPRAPTIHPSAALCITSLYYIYICLSKLHIYIYAPRILGIPYILLHPRTLPLHPGASCI